MARYTIDSIGSVFEGGSDASKYAPTSDVLYDGADIYDSLGVDPFRVDPFRDMKQKWEKQPSYKEKFLSEDELNIIKDLESINEDLKRVQDVQRLEYLQRKKISLERKVKLINEFTKSDWKNLKLATARAKFFRYFLVGQGVGNSTILATIAKQSTLRGVIHKFSKGGKYRYAKFNMSLKVTLKQEEPSIPDPCKKRFYALLIDVRDYKDDDLDINCPIEPIQLIKDTLTTYYSIPQENIILLKNPSQATITSELEKIDQMLEKNSNLLIVFRGHSLPNGFLPQDFQKSETEEEGSPIWTWCMITKYLQKAKAKNILLVADASCKSGGSFNNLCTSSKEVNSSTNSTQIQHERKLLGGRKLLTTINNSEADSSACTTFLSNFSAMLGHIAKKDTTSQDVFIHDGIQYLREIIDADNHRIDLKYRAIPNVGDKNGHLWLRKK